LSERLALAQEFGRLGFWERDPETREGRWDEHMFRIFGLEPGPVPHFDEAARMVHPDDRLDGQFQAALKRPGAYSHRYRVLRHDGSVKHVHTQWRVLAGADGRAERVIGVVVDDTEAHEQAQRAQTERLQVGLALSLARIGTWHMPLPQGPLILDEHMWALSGHPPRPEGITLEEVRGWMHPEDLEEARQATERVIANGEPVDTTTRYRHADGRWLTLLTRRVLQRDGHRRGARRDRAASANAAGACPGAPDRHGSRGRQCGPVVEPARRRRPGMERPDVQAARARPGRRRAAPRRLAAGPGAPRRP
jgi:PAS domain-containing protein